MPLATALTGGAALAQRGGGLLAKVSAKFVEDVAIIFTVRTDGRMAGFNLCPPVPLTLSDGGASHGRNCLLIANWTGPGLPG